MYAVSLTSIPPSLTRLGPVLASLLAQQPAPQAVFLCLPDEWRRFPGPVALPVLPEGVTLLRTDADHGPATKALPASRRLAGSATRLIYCDDDWIMPPGWAAALLAGGPTHEAVAATGYSVSRLKRRSHRETEDPGLTDIAQGFSGVSVYPEWLAGPAATPPPAARAADDIWLSGQLARQGIPVRLAPTARQGLTPAFDDCHAMQDIVIGGKNRHAANLACLDLLHRRHGLWPPDLSRQAS